MFAPCTTSYALTDYPLASRRAPPNRERRRVTIALPADYSVPVQPPDKPSYRYVFTAPWRRPALVEISSSHNSSTRGYSTLPTRKYHQQVPPEQSYPSPTGPSIFSPCCAADGVSSHHPSGRVKWRKYRRGCFTSALVSHRHKTHLLAPLPAPQSKVTLIIDLDETLVHSSFKPVPNADFIVPVEIEGIVHQVYVMKRPFVDEFLQRVGPLFECVLFTASLGKYADPVADLLDKWNVFAARLFREACVPHQGTYVKDLNMLGRDLDKVLILDNSAASYIWHIENAVDIRSWFDDLSDTQLMDLLPLLETLATVPNVRTALRTHDDASGGASPTPSP